MRFLPVNLSAFMVELQSLEQTMALTDSLTRQPIKGIEEITPAARTVLVRYNPRARKYHCHSSANLSA
ncbi:Allophanate hydrolase subunit 1 [Providencia alcalifaciens]|nr:Allophanate hydrolase subunit 1 [Providencia alcalifaciens]